MAIKDENENSIPLLDVEAQREADGSGKSFDAEPPAVAPTPTTISAAARKKFLIWTAINMASTIGIVFTNKAIFNDPNFKLMQTSFACFHFICTGLTLYVVSSYPSRGISNFADPYRCLDQG